MALLVPLLCRLQNPHRFEVFHSQFQIVLALSWRNMVEQFVHPVYTVAKALPGPQEMFVVAFPLFFYLHFSHYNLSQLFSLQGDEISLSSLLNQLVSPAKSTASSRYTDFKLPFDVSIPLYPAQLHQFSNWILSFYFLSMIQSVYSCSPSWRTTVSM